MARVAVGFLLLWLYVYGCMRGLGQSLECASGFIDQENLTIGRQVRSRTQQQRIIPQLNFTCNGSLTKWIFAASWNDGTDHDLYPDLQIWRPNGNGTYMKVQNSTINITAQNTTNRYEYILNPPLEFCAGDIVGIFQPSQTRSRLYMQYYQGNMFSQVMSYYLQTTTSQLQNFSTSGRRVISENLLPLITVDVEIDKSTELQNSQCTSGFVTEEVLTILTVLVAQRNQVQRIIPSLRFDCDGAITKWIVGASWRNATAATSFPDLQIWRNSSTNGVYTKVGNTTLIATSSNSSRLYAFPVEPSLQFRRGDILGIFQPIGPQSRLSILYRTGRGNPLNFVFRPPENVTEPPLEIFTTSSSSIIRQTVLPLVTMEISRSTSAVTQLLLTATARVKLSPTSTTFSQIFSSLSRASSSLMSDTLATSHLLSTPATSIMSDTLATSHLLSTPATSLTSGTPVISVSPMPSVSPSSFGGGNMEGSFFVSAIGTVAGVGGSFLLAVIIVVLVVTVLLLLRRKKKTYSVSMDTDEHTLQNPLYGDQGQVDTLPVRSTKASELNANGACSALSGDGEYELVRGRGASENTEFNFSNPLYAEPERVIACEIYESSNLDATSLEWGFCVPTEEQRRKLSSLSESDLYSTVYSDVNIDPAKEQVFFQESNIYWAPSSNPTELYAQLAKYKFREILSHQIKITDHLGSGQFGSVDKGVWTSPEGQVEVAVKQLKEGTSEADRVKFLKEAAIMGQFQHPNVIKLHGVVTMAEPAMIILEFMLNGDLRDYLIKSRPSLGEMTTPETPQLYLKFCHQVASGMKYLAGKAFVHRDLAARNILVSVERNCKIADFGMARDLEESDYYISHGGKVPVKWTAPEATNFKKYSTASDVWSFGVLLFEIWSLGHKPFEEYTNLEVVRLVGDGYRLSPPPGCPKAIYTLMTNCWHPDTASRPTFSELYQALSQPDSDLLGWSEEDMSVHPQAAVLGAPLEAGKDLYRELQEMYISRDNN